VHTWSAEERVDEARAAELIRAQFPELAARSVQLVSEGWDYVVYRVDEAWAFRFPRREVVVPGMEREIRCLPLLAPRLPVGLPVPTYVGTRFYGAPYLPGREATQADAPALAARLGRALRALHDVQLELDLPDDPIRRVDMPFRVAQLRERGVDADALLAEAEALPSPAHTSICHGDLHVRQLLVDDSGLTGIVDWVDLCRSDPAVDVSIAWSLLDADARATFFAEYGAIDRDREIRARIVALFLSALIADWARAENVPDVLETAAAGMRRAIDG
jgi:aminoglycoside phosphotransferase (APT) family kinase protein